MKFAKTKQLSINNQINSMQYFVFGIIRRKIIE